MTSFGSKYHLLFFKSSNSLLIFFANKDNLLSEADKFLLNQDQAKKIIDDMYKIVKNEWYAIARQAGVTETDCEKIKSSFVYEGFNYNQKF